MIDLQSLLLYIASAFAMAYIVAVVHRGPWMPPPAADD